MERVVNAVSGQFQDIFAVAPRADTEERVVASVLKLLDFWQSPHLISVMLLHTAASPNIVKRPRQAD